MAVLAAVIVFSVIILVHELGHFVAAKAVGITVEEFAIGFGPRLIGWKRSGTEYSLRLFPLGGYVKMLGENEEEAVTHPTSYLSKTPWQRMLVIAAGPVMNFALALVLFILIFGALGVYVDEPGIGATMPGLPAEQAGILPGDEVVAIDGRQVASWTDIQTSVRQSEGQPLVFTVKRAGQIIDIEVVPRLNANEVYEVGIAPPVQRLSVGASIVQGTRYTLDVTVAILDSIGRLITRRLPADDITGPIGIVYFVGQAARNGLLDVMSLAALISVNLGLFNLMPIPALDGSKLVFIGIELLRRKPLDPHKENLVHLVGFALLISLMLIVMYRDILRFIL